MILFYDNGTELSLTHFGDRIFANMHTTGFPGKHCQMNLSLPEAARLARQLADYLTQYETTALDTP